MLICSDLCPILPVGGEECINTNMQYKLLYQPTRVSRVRTISWHLTFVETLGEDIHRAVDVPRDFDNSTEQSVVQYIYNSELRNQLSFLHQRVSYLLQLRAKNKHPGEIRWGCMLVLWILESNPIKDIVSGSRYALDARPRDRLYMVMK